MNELKPCPFCGNDGVVAPVSASSFLANESRKGYRAECFEGCCVGRIYSTEEEAIEAWNRRVSDEN